MPSSRIRLADASLCLIRVRRSTLSQIRDKIAATGNNSPNARIIDRDRGIPAPDLKQYFLLAARIFFADRLPQRDD
jgi:hypothetical protein